jgi:hypothetical protein
MILYIFWIGCRSTVKLSPQFAYQRPGFPFHRASQSSDEQFAAEHQAYSPVGLPFDSADFGGGKLG